MRISNNALAAMSPQERRRVLSEMAYPAAAAKRPKVSLRSLLAQAIHLVIPSSGRASQ